MHTKRITVLYGHGKKPTYITTPRGPHKASESIPLIYLVRDMLKLADNSKEAKKIINSGNILVDGRIIKDYRYGVGLMDVISIPKIEKYYRVLCGKKLKLQEISKEDSNFKLCKITGKLMERKARLQINMHDGYSMFSNEFGYKVNDTLVFEIPSRKIVKHIKFEKGKIGLVTKGKNMGKIGVIEDIREGTALRESLAKVGDIEAPSKYVFVIGEEKSMI